MGTLANLMMAAALALPATAGAQGRGTDAKRPTIVLVHGAFAESASWNAVMAELIRDGYPVVAAANPLRSVAGDASYVTSILASIPGDVVLVGHSYGGTIISQAGADAGNVKALVYVAGFALEPGESGATIAGRFPEGTLGQALAKPVAQADGGKDLYIDLPKFRAQFAADVPASEAALMAAAQRPITEAALGEQVIAAAWKSKPSWFIYGSLDKNIPRSAHAFMAKRAKARETVEVAGASHVVMISHPHEVAAIIERAAAGR
jgi:pimeloyl-ACP methyl ester carboxylesterase